ncbi:c-type cytochrome domain-containing protein [Algibacillus agarilyticus]|uniref:c-type cytochrome domain-containing protein n=1 Tax=Algibacillus agarilyticus TaxID=2234133 RepID=UPI000DCFBBBB|nr:c-type cytochrome domain-containing protein [Algibacillus agarilyticus]
MDLIQFFGRFHVLVLHLPIGILLMAAVLEAHRVLYTKPRPATLNTIWLWGFMSAVGAATLGYMLSLSGGYDEKAIFIHKLWGFSVVACSLFCWWFFNKPQFKSKRLATSLCSLQLVVLFSTGHYGANMTHGSTFLFEHAPNSLRTLIGMPPHAKERPKITQLSQADVYLDVIQPILNKRCTTCHNPEKSKGKLDLTSINAIFTGGKSGPAIVAGDLEKSELFKRITLDPHNKKYMPAGGKQPLNEYQISTLQWWIQANAPTQGQLSTFNLTPDEKKNVAITLGLQASANAWPLLNIQPIDNNIVQDLMQHGFVVKQIAEKNNYIDLDYSTASAPLSAAGLQSLMQAKAHIVWLNFAGHALSSAQYKALSTLPNLLKLRLDQSSVTDEDITHLSKLNTLRYLNLYKTGVSDAITPDILKLSQLTQIFLGETNLSQAAINQLNEHLTVIALQPEKMATTANNLNKNINDED